MDRVIYSPPASKISHRPLWRATAALMLFLLAFNTSANEQAILEGGERFHPVQGTQGMVATSHTLPQRLP